MKKIFPHITIILALMTLTFFVINQFNEMMGFMSSTLSHWVFAALAVFAIISSVRLILCDWEEVQRERSRRRRRERMVVAEQELAALCEEEAADK